MKKEQKSQQNSQHSAENVLSKEESLSADKPALKDKSDGDPVASMAMIDALYYIGGLFVFFGMYISLRQHFAALSPFNQIVRSLGLSIVAYLIGVLLVQNKNLTKIAQVSFFVSALSMPIGLLTVYVRAGWGIDEYPTLILIATILFGLYLGAYLIFRKNILLFLSIIFATLLIYILLIMVAGLRPTGFLNHPIFNRYLILLTGITYTIMGYNYSKDNNKWRLGRTLYALGTLAYWYSAFHIGVISAGMGEIQLLQLLFLCVAVMNIALSAYLKYRILLVINSLILIWYVGLYSLNNHASFGIVFAGLVLIIFGYRASRINKKRGD